MPDITPSDQDQKMTEQRETPAPEDDEDDDALPEIDSGSEGWKEVVKKEREARRLANRELNTLKREKAERETQAKREQDAALAEQGKWKELAEQRATRVGELEPLAEQVTELSAALTGYLEREREGLPAHVLEALAEMPLTRQLAFITKHREALKPQTGANGTHIPPTPNGVHERGITEAERDRRRQMVARQARGAL